MIRIFVGCSPNHEDAELQATLEWSLRKNASEPIAIRWMKLERGTVFEGWDLTRSATPFTPFRWAVPELCNFEGRAIYVDVDFVFLADVAELYHQPIPRAALARSSGRLCLMVWDCRKARKFLPPVAKLKRMPLAHSLLRPRVSVTPFEGDWNCLDGESCDLRRVKAVHFTYMPTQPHLPRAMRRLAEAGQTHWFDGKIERHWRKDVIDLFETTLEEAEANGFGVERYTRAPIYGPYRKQSVAGIGRPAWARRAPC